MKRSIGNTAKAIGIFIISGLTVILAVRSQVFELVSRAKNHKEFREQSDKDTETILVTKSQDKTKTALEFGWEIHRSFR